MATQNLMCLNPANFSSVLSSPHPHVGSMLLGLPCARCRVYYAAVLGGREMPLKTRLGMVAPAKPVAAEVMAMKEESGQ